MNNVCFSHTTGSIKLKLYVHRNNHKVCTTLNRNLLNCSKERTSIKRVSVLHLGMNREPTWRREFQSIALWFQVHTSALEEVLVFRVDEVQSRYLKRANLEVLENKELDRDSKQ